MTNANPPGASPAPPAPADLAPRLWETLQDMDLPEEILSDLAEYPEAVGDILLDTVEHLDLVERPDLAGRLLEAIRAHPPTRETGQYASYSLAERLRAAGQAEEADTVVGELLRAGGLEPGPAYLLAEEFEESGPLDEALRCYNIASRDRLAEPAENLAGRHRFALMPLLGRARVRQRLGMAEDEHDRAALAAAENPPAAGDPFAPEDEDWDEFSHLDAGAPGWDDGLFAPPDAVRGLKVVFSRACLPRAGELGLIDAGATEADHYLGAERELRQAAREHPDTLFAVVAADADEVAAFAEEHGLDPSDEATRGAWAEKSVPNDSPRLLPWPPERNKPCWCTSGRKYKKCCGSPSLR